MTAPSPENPVLSIYQNGIQVITLNRPKKLNAVNLALTQGLLKAFEDANANDDVRVIVLNGAGKAFCAGADLSHVQDDLLNSDKESTNSGGNEAEVEAMQAVTRQIINSHKFVVGAVQGYAVGAGFEWVLNCDFTLWANDAQAFFPEMQWGLFNTGAVTGLLPRMVGLVKAREMLLFGERYSAEQLHAMGAAWKVVPLNALNQETMAVAKKIAALPTHSVAQLKPAINGSCTEGLEWSLQTETKALVKALDAADTKGLVKARSKNVKDQE